MAIFPCIMFVCYLILIAYFRSQGGYKAQVLTGHAPKTPNSPAAPSPPAKHNLRRHYALSSIPKPTLRRHLLIR